MDPFAKTRLKYTTHLQSTGTAPQWKRSPASSCLPQAEVLEGRLSTASPIPFGDLLNVEPAGIALVLRG